MKSKTKNTVTPQERVRQAATAYLEDEQKLLKRHGLKKRVVVTFPQSKTVPFLGRAAVWLLKRSKAAIDVEFALIK